MDFHQEPELDITLGEVWRVTSDTNARVRAIEKALFQGNGSPPVLARLATIEAKNQKRDDRAAWIEVARFIGYMVAALALGLGLTPR